jgi:hypothetical protein
MGKKKPIYNNVQKQSVVNKLKKGCSYNIISTRDKKLGSSTTRKDCQTYKG